MGKVLRQTTRDTDVVARYGGDEFVVILPQTAAEDAEVVGRRILEVLGDRTVAGPREGLSLRSSAGVSVLPAHTFSPADLRQPFPHGYFQGVAQGWIRQADEALSRARRQGRGRLCSGEPAGWEPLAG